MKSTDSSLGLTHGLPSPFPLRHSCQKAPRHTRHSHPAWGTCPRRDEAPLPPSRVCVCNSSACAISTLRTNSDRSGALQCGVSRASKKKKIMHLPWPKHASRATATLGVVVVATTTVLGVVRPEDIVEPLYRTAR